MRGVSLDELEKLISGASGNEKQKFIAEYRKRVYSMKKGGRIGDDERRKRDMFLTSPKVMIGE
jgi:hypothetical protein